MKKIKTRTRRGGFLSQTIYDKGYSDGKYGFTYIDPRWTYAQVQEWAEGYKDGQKTKTRKNPYVKDRFYKTDAIIQHTYEGRNVRESAMIYSYESHKTLYDVTVANTTKRVYFTKNMQASGFLPAHEEIMRHFNLKD